MEAGTDPERYWLFLHATGPLAACFCFALTADMYSEKVGVCYGLKFVLQRDK